MESRPILGTGRAPVPYDITAAVELSRHVTWLLAGLLVLAGTAGGVYRRSGLDAGLAPGREGGGS